MARKRGWLRRGEPSSAGMRPPIQIHAAVSSRSRSAISTDRANASMRSRSVACSARSSMLSTGRPSSAMPNFAKRYVSFHSKRRRYALRRPSPSGGARCAQTTITPPGRASWISERRRARRRSPSSSRSHTVARSRRCGSGATMPKRSSRAGIDETSSAGT